jgi:phospholipase/carboxylesterase
MATTTIGPLRVTALGRGDGPAILLCHGFGAAGDDLVPLARALDAGPGVRWFFPEAPLELPWGGNAWWEIDLVRIQMLQQRGQRRVLAAETPPGLAEARAALEATIEELERSFGVRRDALLIGGFSQGAMLTTEIACHADRPFAGLAVLSGNLLSEDRWKEALRRTGPSIHALVAHGRNDPLLPFEGAEALRDALTASGAVVDWLAHDGQHEIPVVVLRRLEAFARRRLARADST